MLLEFALAGVILSEYIQLISDRGTFLGSLWGRSKCDSCNKEIPWYALIPFFGRFITDGKCPYCGKKISWKYFWFEVLFSAGWIGILYFWQGVLIGDPLLVGSLLLLYCATWLLMYEDLKHYSVPVSWLLAWVVIYSVVWAQVSGMRFHLMDTLLMLGTLALAILVVVLRKPKQQRDIGSLFGAADIIVLVLFTLLLGFQFTTAILVLTMINALLFLIFEKRLRVGQRLPLLTVMLPWGFLALFLLI